MIQLDYEDGSRGDLNALRERNVRRLLDLLLERRAGATQQEIAAATELSRTTVSTLLSQVAKVLAVDGETPRRYRIDPDTLRTVGVDVGRTHLSVAVMDPFGALVAEPRTQTGLDVLGRPHAILNHAAPMVLAALDDAGADERAVAGMTIGLPGAVHVGRGVMNDPSAPAWLGLDARAELAKRLAWASLPRIAADKDANLGALAEFRLGAGRGAGSMLFVKWSSGVGSGLILGAGQVWRGASGLAGEIRHLPVFVSGHQRRALKLPPRDRAPSCPGCSQRECLEQVASGQQVARAAGVRDLASAVAEALGGSRTAREALEAAAALIGTAVGPALTILNVERVVIGGLISREAYPLIAEQLMGGVASTTLPQARVDAELRIGELREAAGVRGAALAALEAHGLDRLIELAAR